VNGASLAAFRIALGLVMALEAWSLGQPNPEAISSGLTPLQAYYTGADIKFHFPYAAFDWLPLFSPDWIYTIVGIQALAGICMAIGFCYRASATAVFLTWGYLWVVESTRSYWQSHYYLETLLTFVMIWMPAARAYSVDAWLVRRRGEELPRTVPYWTVLLLRGQLVIAYFYAGLAKLTADWLLDAVPVRWFLAQPHVTAPYERWLGAGLQTLKSILTHPDFAYFISWTGAGFDLAVGFLLLIRRTRIFALTLMMVFHATNHLLIFDDIGWFPLVGILTALIFLDPDWPERLWKWIKRPHFSKPDWKWFAGGAVVFPVVGATLGWKLKPNVGPAQAAEGISKPVAFFVVAWLTSQALIPMRHFLIPGDGRFTYEGLSFSWRLKSEARRAFAAQIYVIDPRIIARDETGHIRMDWNAWRGDKVVYRRIVSVPIDWKLLPEILVTIEPGAGERVIFNPLPANITTEAQARERAGQIWRETYGRDPQLGLVEIQPLGKAGERPNAPFLVVGDPEVCPTGHIHRDAWKHSQYTRGRPRLAELHVGADPIVMHVGNLGPEALREYLPQACIFDSDAQTPSIWWNSPKDVTTSKSLHLSYHAFYLRRYARRVADLWQKEYGRRSVVRAVTAVSLNGRPHQPLIDPQADLASVPVTWLGHNSWIRDLETPRIPREALTGTNAVRLR
jgi:vitamin K-dependent gamma-carboxylase